jgi:GC-rich sequence DNA-binding factor
MLIRLSSMTEVNRRHQSDADRAVDELISSQSEIERLESKIPDLTERHKFYQDLRGYVTDLVECFNEKVGDHVRHLFNI